MCGLAGLIHRNGAADIGREMTRMLQSLRHRGPDSTGYALYGEGEDDALVMRVKFAEQADLGSGFHIHSEISERKGEMRRRLKERGVEVLSMDDATEYASRLRFKRPSDIKGAIDYLEDIDNVEILSLGRSLELVKDLGDAGVVGEQYGLSSFRGTHAIGHTRMATESAVDIRSAHPYWAYPFSDISVVHNGQLTNYLDFPPRDGAARPPLYVGLRQRVNRRLRRRPDGPRRRLGGGDAPLGFRVGRRLHLCHRHRRLAGHGEGCDGGQADGALRGGRLCGNGVRGGGHSRRLPA